MQVVTEQRLELNYAESDIDRTLAIRAHSGTSHTPERRADHIIWEYVQEMAALHEEFAPYVTADNREEMASDLELYRQRYVQKLTAYLQAYSRVISVLVTGGANFPARRNEKNGHIADRRRDEFLEFRAKAKARLRRKYDPRIIANAPISSDDDEAITKLQAKINKAEALQEMMKQANKVVRTKKLSAEEKVTALIEIEGMTEALAREILKPDYMGRVGFASYQLQNNNANIRRMKGRIEELKAERGRPEREGQTVVIDGLTVTISENREINRLQLFFEGKPPVETRKRLKARGFRWAPSQEAWQRQLNDAARYAAAELQGRS